MINWPVAMLSGKYNVRRSKSSQIAMMLVNVNDRSGVLIFNFGMYTTGMVGRNANPFPRAIWSGQAK